MRSRSAVLALGLAALFGGGEIDAQHRRAQRHAGRSAAAPREGCESPSIHVDKSDGALELRCAGSLRRRFAATFGANPVGPKLREGDERTPEGTYHVVSHGVSGRFHRFMGLSYPNDADLHRAEQLGIDRPGFGVGIHGAGGERGWLMSLWIPFAHRLGLVTRWGPTDGCIALANEDVSYLFRHVRVGTPVTIEP